MCIISSSKKDGEIEIYVKSVFISDIISFGHDWGFIEFYTLNNTNSGIYVPKYSSRH